MSGFLLDTNVVSELIRSRPEPGVEQWVFAQGEEMLFVSAVTCGELRKGIELLAPGRRRSRLEHWLEKNLIPRFQDRILSVTYQIAERWGILDAQCDKREHH